MMAVGLNRSASRLEADRNRASRVPADDDHGAAQGELQAPAVADAADDVDELRRDRSDPLIPSSMSAFSYKREYTRSPGRKGPPDINLRTCDAPAGCPSLSKSLVPREPVRDDHFGAEQEHAGDEQIPPEALLALGVVGCDLGRGRLARGGRARAAGDRGHELLRVERAPDPTRPGRGSRQSGRRGPPRRRRRGPRRRPARSARRRRVRSTAPSRGCRPASSRRDRRGSSSIAERSTTWPTVGHAVVRSYCARYFTS